MEDNDDNFECADYHWQARMYLDNKIVWRKN